MLLGRDKEEQALVLLLDDARASRSGVLALAGEAGIGKSALLAYAGEQAAGMRVLRARGVQSEAQIPFAGLLELLRPALSWIEQLPDPQAAALESALDGNDVARTVIEQRYVHGTLRKWRARVFTRALWCWAVYCGGVCRGRRQNVGRGQRL